jgi:hypothetical protein
VPQVGNKRTKATCVNHAGGFLLSTAAGFFSGIYNLKTAYWAKNQ